MDTRDPWTFWLATVIIPALFAAALLLAVTRALHADTAAPCAVAARCTL